jgi:hypothetical protein
MTKETPKLRCGLVMPISAIDNCSEQHWEDVRSIIKEAMLETDFTVELVSDSNQIGIIQKRIVQNLYDSELVICDVSAKNPNVMFELGMRLAFDKPAIIIKDDKTNYSFDTGQIEHIEYPRDLNYHSIQQFKATLKRKAEATYEASKSDNYTTFLKHFGQFVVAKLDEKKVGRDEYLMSAISELRSEVSSLGKRILLREDRLMPLNELLSASIKNGMSEKDFMEMALRRQPGLANTIKINDPNSNEFDALVEEYLSKYVPPNIAIKGRHADMIKKRLMEAFVSLVL